VEEKDEVEMDGEDGLERWKWRKSIAWRCRKKYLTLGCFKF